jgi:hypothetical protein
MWKKFTTKKDKRTNLEKEIDEVTLLLSRYEPASEEYENITKNLERLNEMAKANKRDWRPSPDTVWVVGGNILGIVLILAYEKVDIITSKAIGFVMKGRV